MKVFGLFIVGVLLFISCPSLAVISKNIDITDVITKEDFSKYRNVADFIDSSPKVTIIVKPEAIDIAEYGSEVVKSLTGSDCDRDGVMDSNEKCNAVYYKLWMKYER
ncbi:MAG: hypothetical protein P8I03_00035 [Thalassotalea sp.]|nr:hypothetical protein [Thalassotalea sp.]